MGGDDVDVMEEVEDDDVVVCLCRNPSVGAGDVTEGDVPALMTKWTVGTVDGSVLLSTSPTASPSPNNLPPKINLCFSTSGHPTSLMVANTCFNSSTDCDLRRTSSKFASGKEGERMRMVVWDVQSVGEDMVLLSTMHRCENVNSRIRIIKCGKLSIG